MRVEAKIQAELERIEAEKSVRILFAVESGSRAWGFPSRDSDYDVRFIYASAPWCYVSVFEDRDVIECPISNELDVSGWDLKKAIGLLRKSNPALMEWANSPIIYQELNPVANAFRDTVRGAFLPLASCHHYRSMARQHQRRAAGVDRVRLKHYLYALRPCLAAQWVVRWCTQPPVAFNELLNALLPNGNARDAVNELLRLKQGSSEVDRVDRIPALDAYIEASLETVEAEMPPATPALSAEECNELFRSTLKECWGEL